MSRLNKVAEEYAFASTKFHPSREVSKAFKAGYRLALIEAVEALLENHESMVSLTKAQEIILAQADKEESP